MYSAPPPPHTHTHTHTQPPPPPKKKKRRKERERERERNDGDIYLISNCKVIQRINSPVIGSSKARVTTGERHALGAIVCCHVNCYNWDVLSNSVEKTQRVLILCPSFLPSFFSCSVHVSRSHAVQTTIQSCKQINMSQHCPTSDIIDTDNTDLGPNVLPTFQPSPCPLPPSPQRVRVRF